MIEWTLSAIFGGSLVKILTLRGLLENTTPKWTEFFNFRLVVAILIDSLLAIGLMYLQFKTTNVMNIVSSFEIGIAAPFVLTKLVGELSGRGGS
jgi:cell shape-determining protein MreD